MTWREAHRQHVMELEAAAARVMLTALDGILAQVAAGFAALVADASPAEARGSIDDAAQIRVEWRAAVHDQVLPWFAGVYEAGAEAAQEQVLGLGIVVPDPLPELLDQAAVEYLAQTAPRLYSLGDDAWDAAHAVILAGFQDGEGIDVIRRRMREYETKTAPLRRYYEERGVLVPIDATAPADEVTRRILAALDARGLAPAGR